jgi:hypothetical protein
MKLFSMIRLVLWSFFGVRNSKSHASDLANVNFTLLPFVAIVLAVLVGAVIYGVVHLVADPTATMQGSERWPKRARVVARVSRFARALHVARRAPLRRVLRSRRSPRFNRVVPLHLPGAQRATPFPDPFPCPR